MGGRGSTSGTMLPKATMILRLWRQVGSISDLGVHYWLIFASTLTSVNNIGSHFLTMTLYHSVATSLVMGIA
jgi:hypothetical protein